MIFSVTLPQVWMFLIGVFDACGVDHHAATKLRVSLLQAAALASCGALTLSALGGFVLSEQRNPSKRAQTRYVRDAYRGVPLHVFRRTPSMRRP